MANEITFSATLRIAKNRASVGQSFSGSLDMAGSNMLGDTQDIGTTAAAVTLGAIAGVPSKLLLVNLDTVNYVEIDSASAMNAFPQKLLAGDVILLSPETATIYAKANMSLTPSWVASTAYAIGDTILDSNGNVQTCTTAGTSKVSPHPTWATALNATTADGTAVWTVLNLGTVKLFKIACEA